MSWADDGFMGRQQMTNLTHPNLRNTPRAGSSVGTGARPHASRLVPWSHHCLSCKQAASSHVNELDFGGMTSAGL